MYLCNENLWEDMKIYGNPQILDSWGSGEGDGHRWYSDGPPMVLPPMVLRWYPLVRGELENRLSSLPEWGATIPNRC